MWSASKQDRCLRASMLILTCAACIGTVYISLSYTGHHLKVHSGSSRDDTKQAAKLTEEKCIPVCDSKECIYEANSLLRSVNTAAEPCDDYHKFLCGSYVEQFGPNENGSVILENTYMLKNKMKGIINNIEAEPESASAKMKIYYDSCVNIGSSDLRGAENFRLFLSHVGIPNWPDLASDFTFHNTSLPKLLATFKAYLAFNVIFYPVSSEEAENQVKDKFVKVGYNTYFLRRIPKDAATEILEYFNIESEKIETIINNFEDVFITLSDLKKDENMTSEEHYNVHVNCSMPDDEAWISVCGLVEHYINIMELKDYARTDEILVANTDVYAIKNLIPRLNLLSERAIANYLSLNLLWNNLEELNFYFRQKMVKNFKHFEDFDRKGMRINNKWMDCIYLITKWMKLPLENEFVHQYLTKSVMEEVLEILYSYIQEVSDLISAQDWIPLDWNAMIAKMIRSLEPNLSHLKEILPNDTLAKDFYKVFRPSMTNFFWNTLEIKRTNLNADFRGMTRDNLFKRFETDFKVNAHTDLDTVITLHYGLVIPPWHFPGFKKWINRLMLIPAVLHEIGHNVAGILEIISQNSSTSEEVFLEKKNCIINQFSQFKFNILDEHLNGTQYYAENLSDNLAYAFLDKFIEYINSSQEYLLPGLSFPAKQQLYMAATQEFCSSSNLKQEIHYKTLDVHPPLEFRIIGPAQNSRKFSEAFHCPEESYMNPKTKCSLLDVM